ncbi:spore germination protein [Mesobacillus maritimus]|uniref:spore germination protein n=1 Tax=Mesobacillus maritimus TaxID=1643336 RepID=UPI0020421C99|nr:spore germination protein [Mesobacillus maritimus]MCM3670208.1 spore germination protein [Mesobacillus maritimus]
MFKVLKKLAGKKRNKRPVGSEDTLASQASTKDQSISYQIEDNIKQMKKIFRYPDNQDIKLRECKIGASEKRVAIFFISTITDVRTIEDSAIGPILENKHPDATIKEMIATQNITSLSTLKEAVQNMNTGNAVIFIEGETSAYAFECANFQGRSVEKAENEVVIKGPKEAFTEKVVVNLSLIRKRIKNEDLMAETVTISTRSKNEVFILYIRNLANEKLVNNIKNRLKNLDVDAIQNLSLLEQYIEERPFSMFPSVLYSERPDRATSFLEDGHIILLMDNSPDSLILPATFWSFFHTSDDHYLRFIFGNFARFIRAGAMFITIFISAIFIAVTTYHSEMIPADLLLAIAGSREKVPFPVFFEILLMEIAFELIREAGLRVPNPMGPTIGIVGALILGQAAVEANIISPIVIIVVALSGLTSFTISDVSLNFALRIIRFIFIFSAGLFGIFGMTSFFVMGIFYLTSLKSFGVPFLAPMSPHYVASGDTIFRRVLKNENLRPGYLKPKDMKKKSDEAVK